MREKAIHESEPSSGGISGSGGGGYDSGDLWMVVTAVAGAIAAVALTWLIG